MRMVLLSAWILVPAVLAGVYFGPARQWLQCDDAARLARYADEAAGREEWELAADRYAAALATLPESERKARRGMQVALGRALVMSGAIVEGQELLTATLADLD